MVRKTNAVKGKQGFQTTTPKPSTPRTVASDKRTKIHHKDDISTVLKTSNIPFLCIDPTVCRVKTHRSKDHCKAYEQMNTESLKNVRGKINNKTPKQLADQVLRPREIFKTYRSRAENNISGLSGYVDDYDFNRHCHETYIDHDGQEVQKNYCDEEGICRCSTLVGGQVKIEDTEMLAKSMLKRVTPTPNPKDIYALAQILNQTNVRDDDIFEPVIEHGYYGEEIVDITTTDAEVQEALKHFFTMKTSDERLRYALSPEYGNVLPQLERAEFSVETIKPKHVRIPPSDQKPFEGLTQEEHENYRWAEIKGLVADNGNGTYTLIDGVHRTMAANPDETATYIVIKN